MITLLHRRLRLAWLSMKLDRERGAMTRCLNAAVDAPNDLARQAWVSRIEDHYAAIERLKNTRAQLRKAA